MRLGVEDQASDEERGDGLGAEVQGRAGGLAVVGRDLEVGAVDAQRDDRELGRLEADVAAEAPAQIVRLGGDDKGFR